MKMSQKLVKLRSYDARILGNFQFLRFEILTHNTVYMDVRTAGPDLVRSGPWSGIPDQFNFGPVRWSGIPDQVKLVRSDGPEFRTNLSWSGPVVRNSGPNYIGPVRWSGIPDRTNLVRIFGPGTRTTGPDQQKFGPVRKFFWFWNWRKTKTRAIKILL